jgi:hypothetical protein
MSSQELVCKSYAYRITSVGRYNKTYVILDGKPVAPAKVEKRIGREVYCLSSDEWKRAIVISLYRTKRGLRDIAIYLPFEEEKAREIAQKIYTYAKYSALTPDEVLDYTLSLLNDLN